MLTTFECPSCGAPLQYEGGPTQHCAYCQTTVIVPPREPQPFQQFQQTPFGQSPFGQRPFGQVPFGQEPFAEWPVQVSRSVVQQRTVVDLRQFTCDGRGGMNRGLKWGIWIFVLFMVFTTLGPFILGVLGVLLSLVLTFLQV